MGLTSTPCLRAGAKSCILLSARVCLSRTQPRLSVEPSRGCPSGHPPAHLANPLPGNLPGQ
eukprot:5523543-Alexandrium_andersonii.AAC.1